MDRVMPMKRVVFLCVENSNRSQMAEAFARMAGGVEAFSAGSRPSGKVNPQAIASMRELGYDLAAHHSKSIEELPAGAFDVAVSMGCGDRCPNLRAARREDWSIPDPKGLPADEFRKVRDLIRTKVDELLIDLQGDEHVDRNEGH
jgi:protein-tyrosine-phosphatase